MASTALSSSFDQSQFEESYKSELASHSANDSKEQDGDVEAAIPPEQYLPVSSWNAKKEQDLQQPPRESLVAYLPPEPLDKVKALAKAKGTSVREVLDALLPPREYQIKNQKLVQRVSDDPATRLNVVELQKALDQKLQERQARENGVCPVREELYSQCFDELIRQVTIESSERGLLLMRVRDEVRMTIAAYQTLYQSSITFGMRKTLQAEQGNSELQQQIEQLDIEKKKLQAQLQDQKGLYDTIEKRIAEQRALEEKKNAEEKEFLRYQAQHLENFLKSAQSQ